MQAHFSIICSCFLKISIFFSRISRQNSAQGKATKSTGRPWRARGARTATTPGRGRSVPQGPQERHSSHTSDAAAGTLTPARNSSNDGDSRVDETGHDEGTNQETTTKVMRARTTMAAKTTEGRPQEWFIESVDSTNAEKTNRMNHAGEQQQPTIMKATTMTPCSQPGETCVPRHTKKRATKRTRARSTASSLPISKVSYDAG